jgi:hypothetical protein
MVGEKLLLIEKNIPCVKIGFSEQLLINKSFLLGSREAPTVPWRTKNAV